MSPPPAPLFYLIAGEPSGDMLGAALMRALRQRTGGVIRFAGIGGEQMAAEGLASEVDIRELAVMGFVELLPRARRLLRLVRETVRSIERQAPAMLVTIDSSGFCFRVGEAVKQQAAKGQTARPPIVHYVAPMVWALRAHRARSAARAADHLLTLLPFEPAYFAAVGLPASFVGHPVVESGLDRGDRAGFRRRHGIAPEAPVLLVLPGSRKSEVTRLLPPFRATVARLAALYPGLVTVVPTVATVADRVARGLQDWPVRAVLVQGVAEKIDAFAAGDVALAASGTVSLELAMAGVPMVISYRIWALTAWSIRRVVKIRYASLVNLLCDRMAIPELIQEDCVPDKLAAAVAHLFDDPAARAAQRAAARQALGQLGLGIDQPSLRAADKILTILEASRGG